MTGHGSKYGRKKDAAIAALLTQRTHADAAKVADISLETLKRWLRLPDFQEALLEARREPLLQAHIRIEQNMGAATSVLLKMLADPATPASTRVRAAVWLIQLGDKSVQLDAIEARLAEIERLLRESKRGKG